MDVFRACAHMRHCHVHRKVDRSVCYDMYSDEGGVFILGCAVDKTMKGKMIFTTKENSHREDIHKMIGEMYFDRNVQAVLSCDWMTGLNFVLLDKRNQKVCDIKFESRIFTMIPVSFKLDLLFNNTGSDSHHSVARPNRRQLDIFDTFACFNDTTCTEFNMDSADSEEEENEQGGAAAGHRTHHYSSVEEAARDFATVHLRTRPPIWNTELQQWLHNFGGRVRFPTFRCFVVTENTEESPLSMAENQNRVFIRHGKVSLSSYVLDYRAPVSPLTALAAMCAVHANKAFVCI